MSRRKSKSGTHPHFKNRGVIPIFLFCLATVFSSCTPVSYPENQVQKAIAEIASKEYQIHEIKTEFVGTTIGVFLPLNQLFAEDFRQNIVSGKASNLETLFQPTEEAIDKVEDVLLSMSRVILSTDKKIEFYYLQATDVEKTGMELAFTGHIEDVKRVRFWDIPRSEYRKRVIHDLRLNRAALWHRPVHNFFTDLNNASPSEIQARYFPHTDEKKWAREFLFADESGHPMKSGRGQWDMLDLRSMGLGDNQVVVYAKVKVSSKNKKTPTFSPKILEYLFQVTISGSAEKIQRIIPMVYLGDKKVSSGLTFTKQMLYESLPTWDVEFKVPGLTMGDFLALQLSRRLQQAVVEDERIYNTFSNIKLIFHYEKKPKPFFTFDAVAPLRSPNSKAFAQDKGIHEDILYLWSLAARELADVVRSYDFRGFQFLQFHLTQDEETMSWNVPREGLELFRRHKKDLKNILTVSPNLF